MANRPLWNVVLSVKPDSIQIVVNKFRVWFCNYVWRRSCDAPLCLNMAFSLLSPGHKGRTIPVRQCFCSFCQRSTCTSATLHFGPGSKHMEEKEQGLCTKVCVKLGGNGAKILLVVASAWVLFVHWRSAIRATVKEQGRGCSLRIRPWRWNSELAVLCWGSEAIETDGCSQVAKGTGIPRVGSASRQCTRANRSFCSGFFYQIMALQWFSNQSTPLTWLPLNSRCFPNLQWH